MQKIDDIYGDGWDKWTFYSTKVFVTYIACNVIQQYIACQVIEQYWWVDRLSSILSKIQIAPKLQVTKYKVQFINISQPTSIRYPLHQIQVLHFLAKGAIRTVFYMENLSTRNNILMIFDDFRFQTFYPNILCLQFSNFVCSSFPLVRDSIFIRTMHYYQIKSDLVSFSYQKERNSSRP